MLFYRLLLILALPVLCVRMAAAWLSGRETLEQLAQRFSGGAVPEIARQSLWVHGASLGELTAAKTLISAMLATNYSARVLVTCNTTTGLALVDGWGNDRITARLAPLDNPTIVRRFLNRWQPTALITLENEIWPNRVLAAKARGIPVIVVAGRLSAKSAAMWARFPRMARRVMGAPDAMFPMDAENGERFIGLGLGMDRLRQVVNLKTAVVLSPPDPNDLARYSTIFDREKTILAASSHPGEEEQILQAFSEALKLDLDLRLIMAPRHAKRSDEVAGLIQKTGIEFRTRSAGQDPRQGTPIYLADTTGEMALWYSLSAIVLLGGSWVAKGGHSPVEPVQFGAIVVHGPDVSNHKAVYAALLAANACVQVANATDMGQFLVDFSRNGVPAGLKNANARKTLADLRDKTAATAPIIKTISELTRQI